MKRQEWASQVFPQFGLLSVFYILCSRYHDHCSVPAELIHPNATAPENDFSDIGNMQKPELWG